MALLTTADIASLRALQEEAMPDSGVISRPPGTSDGRGGTTTTTYTVIGTVPVRVSPSGSFQQVIAGGRVAAKGDYLLTMPYGTDARAADRVAVSGRTFEVLAPLLSSYATALVLDCNEVL
jgi:head-tail adaptor